MDLLQLDDEEQEILQILAENGIKVTNPKKKHQSRIQILENILVYKPDNELLHAINIAAESDPSFKCPKESPLEVDVQASNLGSLLSVATENGPEIEFVDTFSVTGIDEELDESGLETIDNEGPENKPKRIKHAACTEWQRNITKEKRMRGESYSGYSRKEKQVTTGIQRSKRQMGPTCDSNFCKNSAKRFCAEFGEHDRQFIFDNFWKELDWSGKKSFVSSMIDRIPIKQKTVDSHKRQQSYVYYLKLNEETNQVCKKCF
ncbi:unnamed protein product [Parnassius apollo]|uniref:(apollo) hypothetical protein n=1 Tax=Parnassius apollo TaxID=110799 RepID=A0A8S3Y063_PARAO|nr:unnamed protein product [Parnassius apollo]